MTSTITFSQSRTLAALREEGGRVSTGLALRLAGPDGERTLPLGNGPTTVGGGPRCDVRLVGEGVRPLHCVITCQDGAATVRRWAGEARLNGEEFAECSLEAGDCLSVGGIEIVVVDDEPTSPHGDFPTETEAPSASVGAAPGAQTISRSSLVDNLDEGHLEEGHSEEGLWEDPGAAPSASQHLDDGWESDAYGATNGQSEAGEPDKRAASDPTRPSATNAIRRRTRNLVGALREQRRADAQNQEALERLERERQEQLERAESLQAELDARSEAVGRLEAERDGLRESEQALRASHEAALAELDQLQARLEEQRGAGEQLAELKETLERERGERNEELARLRAEVERAEAAASDASAPAQEMDEAPEAASPRTGTVPMSALAEAIEEPDVEPRAEDQVAPDECPTAVDEAGAPADDGEFPWSVARTCPLPPKTSDDPAERFDGDEPTAEEAASFPGLPEEPEDLETSEDPSKTDTPSAEWEGEQGGGELPEVEPPTDAPYEASADAPAEPSVSDTQSLESCVIEGAEDPSPQPADDGPSCEIASCDNLAIDDPPADSPDDATSASRTDPLAVKLLAAPVSHTEQEEATQDTTPDERDEDAPGVAPASFYERYAHLLPADDKPETGGAVSGVAAPADGAATPADAAPEGANGDDIEGYMAQLMRRMRSEDTEPGDGGERSPSPASAAPALLKDAGPGSPTSGQLLKGLDALKRDPAPEHGADMESMRNLANESARHAIGVSVSRINVEKAIANLVIAVIALASGAFLINAAPALYSTQLVAGTFATLLAGVLAYRSLAYLFVAARARVQGRIKPAPRRESGELPISNDPEASG